ncbi:MAG TPA: heme-binding protein [Casimicrobiaceae bacterium]|nr:heme-binding protein [Casimicrobiaceae bacterium]
MNALKTLVAGIVLAGAGAATAQDATFSLRLLTPDTALKAAQAALARCRADGFQVAVAVVDRMGVAQVMLRDRFAGPHTPDMATAKAWTAVSFRTDTTDLAAATQGGPSSGVRHRPGVAAVGGGLMIQAAGSLLGAIGVSGAPGGKEDDACAAAGIAAIRDSLEL